MEKYSLILVIILILCIQQTSAQTGNRDNEGILGDLYHRITNTRDDIEKLRLNDSIRHIIGSYAGSDSVFSHRFDNLRYLGQITSPDKKLKIITWNVFLNHGPNSYFCYIIKKGVKRKPNQVYILIGSNREEPVRTDIIYTADNWYGALYYTIQPFKKGRKLHYILLGLDYGNIKVSRKIIDVLSFTEEGDLSLGLDCINKDMETLLREVIEYSPEGIVTLRIENSKTIVFDQLVTITTGHGDGSELSAAGISFNGYVLNKGIWRFVSGIDVKNKKKN